MHSLIRSDRYKELASFNLIQAPIHSSTTFPQPKSFACYGIRPRELKRSILAGKILKILPQPEYISETMLSTVVNQSKIKNTSFTRKILLSKNIFIFDSSKATLYSRLHCLQYTSVPPNTLVPEKRFSTHRRIFPLSFYLNSCHQDFK